MSLPLNFQTSTRKIVYTNPGIAFTKNIRQQVKSDNKNEKTYDKDIQPLLTTTSTLSQKQQHQLQTQIAKQNSQLFINLANKTFFVRRGYLSRPEQNQQTIKTGMLDNNPDKRQSVSNTPAKQLTQGPITNILDHDVNNPYNFTSRRNDNGFMSGAQTERKSNCGQIDNNSKNILSRIRTLNTLKPTNSEKVQKTGELLTDQDSLTKNMSLSRKFSLSRKTKPETSQNILINTSNQDTTIGQNMTDSLLPILNNNEERAIARNYKKVTPFGVQNNSDENQSKEDGKEELYLEIRLKKLLNDAKSNYLKTRIKRLIDKLEKFKENTKKNVNLDQAFKFVLKNDRLHRKENTGFLVNKYTDLSLLKMKDIELVNNIDLDSQQYQIEMTLKSVEQEEQILSRMVEKYKQIAEKSKKQKNLDHQINRRFSSTPRNPFTETKLKKQANNLTLEDKEWDEQVVNIKRQSQILPPKHPGFPLIIKEKHKVYQKFWKEIKHDMNIYKREPEKTEKYFDFGEIIDRVNASGGGQYIVSQASQKGIADHSHSADKSKEKCMYDNDDYDVLKYIEKKAEVEQQKQKECNKLNDRKSEKSNDNLLDLIDLVNNNNEDRSVTRMRKSSLSEVDGLMDSSVDNFVGNQSRIQKKSPMNQLIKIGKKLSVFDMCFDSKKIQKIDSNDINKLKICNDKVNNI